MAGQDETYMMEALKQGEVALADGEVPVGCIFVYKNEIIATAANKTNETCNVLYYVWDF